MDSTYIIGGMGNSAANVIESSLGDVKNGARFIYLWTGKPTAGQARVLDWLIDYSAKYVVYSETPKIPQSVADSAVEVVLVENVIERSIADFAGSAKMLVLFDVDEHGNPTAMTERLILKAAEAGMPVLELTNGLIPITVEEEDESPAPAPKPAPDPSKLAQDALKAKSGTPAAGWPGAAPKAAKSVVFTYLMTIYSDGSVELTPR